MIAKNDKICEIHMEILWCHITPQNISSTLVDGLISYTQLDSVVYISQYVIYDIILQWMQPQHRLS